MKTRFWIKICLLILVVTIGSARLYYVLNEGFTIGNISSQSNDNIKWKTRTPSSSEISELDTAVNQSYTYLGRGCQSYVFISHDGNYVLKFIKHQSFRSKPWVNAFSFIPSVNTFKERKVNEKKIKLENLLWSWKTAFENLPQETGVIYVHLNKIPQFKKTVTFYDKLGFKHRIDLDQMDFLIQKRASLLCPTIAGLMANGNSSKAQEIIEELITMLITENQRGYIDNDHALIQNTGVIEGHPIHIDVGQLIYNETVKEPAVYKSELYNKIYHFYKWLEMNHSELAFYLEKKLSAEIGPDFYQLTPNTRNANIPNQGLDK